MSEYVWPLVFVALGAIPALWFGWQLHPFWCRYRDLQDEAHRELFRARLDLIDAQAEIRGLRARAPGDDR